MTIRHNPSTIWPVPQGFRQIYAHGVEVVAPKRILYISGQLGVRPDGTVATSFADQAAQAMANIKAVLARAGMTTSHIVKVTYLVTDEVHIETLAAVRRLQWASDTPPSVTTYVVKALVDPRYLIEIEAIAAES